MAKSKKDRIGIVYSTDTNFQYQFQSAFAETLPPQQQVLRVQYERKNRGGKEATVITGFVGQVADLEALAKLLKQKCGVGGSAKDNEIILQGNWKDKVIALLKEQGYSQTK